MSSDPSVTHTSRIAMGLMSKAKFKNVDFYRKIPKDMTEGTIKFL